MSVRSLETSATFYREALGFGAAPARYVGTGRRLSALMEIEGCQLEGLFLRHDAFFLELLRYDPVVATRTLPHRDDDVGWAHLSMVVADIDATGAAVETHGGTSRWHTRTELSFGEGAATRIMFCADPDGNRIELIQHGDARGRDEHARFLGTDALGWSPHPAVAPWS